MSSSKLTYSRSQLLNKPTPSIQQIAKKHRIDYTTMMHELQRGIQTELEHTNSISVAKEIALDHLNERPDYYRLINKLEQAPQYSSFKKYRTESKNVKKFSEMEIALMEGGHSIDTPVLSELNVPQTLRLIKQAHGEQLYGNLPYWTHPKAVAIAGKKFFGNQFNSNAVKTAFLHDVVEDTHVTLDELKQLEFDPEVIYAVRLLTKNPKLSYEKNIQRIINSGNVIAMMVKYADNYVNYTGDKNSWDSQKAQNKQQQYLKSMNLLGQELNIDNHKYLAQTLSLEEGWKDWVAGAGIAASIVGGGSAYNAYKDRPAPAEKPQVTQATPKPTVKTVTGNPDEAALKNAAIAAGITGIELAQFLAQTAHETKDFDWLIEVGSKHKSYEPKFLKNKRTNQVKINPVTKKPINLNQKAINLGNTQPGDGKRFKGRGYIQLTGRDNYRMAGKALGLDLVNNPELAAVKSHATDIAIWYWKTRVRPKISNFNDTKAVTNPINSGADAVDIEKRAKKFKIFKSAMSAENNQSNI